MALRAKIPRGGAGTDSLIEFKFQFWTCKMPDLGSVIGARRQLPEKANVSKPLWPFPK